MSGEDNDIERAAKRQIGRARAYELQTKANATGKPFAWFEELYTHADGDGALVPWEMAAPRFRLAEWLAGNPGNGRRACDVGCGLGDNARLIADAGWDVTAFDISATAAAWAEKRHAGAPNVSFHAADLFDPPPDWLGAFDLVHETYNLQAMPRSHLDAAVRAIAALVKPGGRLVIITRFAAPDREPPPEGPPWPLEMSTLEGLKTAGLRLLESEFFDDRRDPPIAHLLAAYERPG